MKLHLVCDTSGSMGDGGKSFITRTLVLAIAHWAQGGHGSWQLSLCRWADEACAVPAWQPLDEFPEALLACHGGSSCAALIRFFGPAPEGKILLFSDGFWPPGDLQRLRRWQEGLPPDTLRIIQIGADDKPQVKGLNAFAPEAVFAALDGWLQGGPP